MQTDYFCYIVESIFDEGRLNSWIFFWPSLIHRFVSTLVDPGFWQTNSRLCLLPDLMNNYLHRDFLEVPLSRLKRLSKCLWVLKYVSFSGEKKHCCNWKSELAKHPMRSSYSSPEHACTTVFRGVKSDTLECFISLSLCLVSHNMTLHITSWHLYSGGEND